MKNKKVLLAMSGGVDSSVAALLLKNQGYDVTGAFMINYSDTKDSYSRCTWREERKMALKIAAILDIPLITLNFEKEYKKYVVDEMFKLYKIGITPNPDVDCNNKIKFPLLKKAAKKLGCDLIATGHYARIKPISSIKNKPIKTISTKSVNLREGDHKIVSHGRAGVQGRRGVEPFLDLHRAKDETKDQSYFLYRLGQPDLKNTLFPIGDLTKKQVREIAKKNKFPNYNKKGTVGICFIGKVNLKKFLSKKIKPKKGRILDPDKNQIGTHDGFYYYTINQRIGPRYGIEVKKIHGKPMQKFYVAKKIPKTNTIIAAPENHPLLFRKQIIISSPHWINENPLENSTISKSKKTFRVNKSLGAVAGGVADKTKLKLHARIRQVGELLPCILEKKKNKLIVTLNKPITGISEGQAIVLYKKTKCLGGGVISFN